MSTYKLTLHKKSYLLTGITKDDSNKEKVKELGAKWNGFLSGWLFFPEKHKEGLKFAKDIGAEIDKKITNDKEKSPKKESKEEKKKCECCEKYKLEIEKLKQELEKLQDKCDRMGDVLGENGLGIDDSDEENKDNDQENKYDKEVDKLAFQYWCDDGNYLKMQKKVDKCEDLDEDSKTMEIEKRLREKWEKIKTTDHDLYNFFILMAKTHPAQ